MNGQPRRFDAWRLGGLLTTRRISRPSSARLALLGFDGAFRVAGFHLTRLSHFRQREAARGWSGRRGRREFRPGFASQAFSLQVLRQGVGRLLRQSQHIPDVLDSQVLAVSMADKTARTRSERAGSTRGGSAPARPYGVADARDRPRQRGKARRRRIRRRCRRSRSRRFAPGRLRSDPRRARRSTPDLQGVRRI